MKKEEKEKKKYIYIQNVRSIEKNALLCKQQIAAR